MPAVVVDGEVVDGEPAGDRRAQRPRLDDRGVPGLGERGRAAHRCRRRNRPAPPPGPVSSAEQRQRRPRRRGCPAPAGLGQRAVGDQPGVRLDREVRLEPVLAAVHGLVRVPGLGVDDARSPGPGRPAGRSATARRCRRSLDGFDVLPGDQRQQRHRLRRASGPSSCSGRCPSSRCASPTRASTSCAAGLPRRPRRSPACPGRRSRGAVQCSAITSAAPGTSRRTRRIAAISWVTVSWVATASSRTVESNARRVLPVSTPVSATTCRTASKIRFGAPTRPAGAASTSTWSGGTPPP